MRSTIAKWMCAMANFSLSDKLLSAIIFCVVAYVGTGIANHFIIGGRIEAGLIAEINDASLQLKDVSDSAESLMVNHIKEGQRVFLGADYYRHDYGYYKAYIKDLSSYLSKDELGKVIKYYSSLNEFDDVADSFFKRVRHYHETQEPLTIYQVLMLERTRDRLSAIRSIVGNNYSDIDSLPSDYSARITPKQTIQR